MKTATPEKAPRKPRFSWRRLMLALPLVALLLWLAWTLLWQIGFGLPGYADFYLHQSKYRNIIAKVKAQTLAPGASTQEWVDGYLVDVARSPPGSYAVTITTADRGHAGVYGYTFSDTPLTAHPDENAPTYPVVDNPGSLHFVDGAILGQGGHWWSVYDDGG